MVFNILGFLDDLFYCLVIYYFLSYFFFGCNLIEGVYFDFIFMLLFGYRCLVKYVEI